MDKSVLILGGSYFIGRKIAIILSESGYNVSILNRGTKTCPAENIEQIICDRNDEDNMKKVLKGRIFDYVIDVSWKDCDWVKTLCSSLCFDKVKAFIFLSSSAVYDVEHLQVPFNEDYNLAENKYWTFYGKGKIQAEEYYKNFFKNKPTRLVILRPPYIYGEYNYAQRESFIFKHICEETTIIIPKSNPLLQFIYSGDLAHIMKYLIEKNTEKLAVYNVGNKVSISSSQWIDFCSKIVGKPAKTVICDYENIGRTVRDFFPFFDYDNILDVKKINNLYSKELPFEEGLKKSYDWYLNNKSDITFKENIEQNIYNMILELNK